MRLGGAKRKAKYGTQLEIASRLSILRKARSDLVKDSAACRKKCTDAVKKARAKVTSELSKLNKKEKSMRKEIGKRQSAKKSEF